MNGKGDANIGEPEQTVFLSVNINGMPLHTHERRNFVCTWCKHSLAEQRAVSEDLIKVVHISIGVARLSCDRLHPLQHLRRQLFAVFAVNLEQNTFSM